ncbi:poly-gamma-glutamate synthesis protein (capsule biosynthesis protein) [Streptococcus rupicaprae]|uniref:Poly-gamma-glutamate synthesis protein (Capsule biosynthesis protein) n=1 Tax=Streptococcus rupicaprae TaxID=759619 RepID=A0ABV2FET3_9STRE
MEGSRRAKHATKDKGILGLALGMFLVLIIGYVFLFHQWQKGSPDILLRQVADRSQPMKEDQPVQTARIMAHGDLLYHDILYMSALQADGTYDFSGNFDYVKPWFDQADLVIGDFEGTIAPELPLAGYPLFNAPASVATAIKDAGYDVLDLAHNHILDSYLSGLISTAKTFNDLGIATVGVYPEGNRATAPILIKEVNGIKVAILAYAYGFNGMEANLTPEEQAAYLSDLSLEQMQKEIEAAEELADVTLVMPQMGVEYSLEPTQEQQELYRQMVTWGADIVLGGHPHVVEPAEVLDKDGEQKLIIYSMGNFISNQRIETMGETPNAQWTERGVLMDVTLEKVGDKTTIKRAKAHPTWVSRVENGGYSPEGFALYDYKTLVLEDFIPGGPHRDQLTPEIQARIDTAYEEMNALVGLNWEARPAAKP